MRSNMELGLIEGNRARRENTPRFKNPYNRLEVKFLAWDMGWMGGSEEDVTYRVEWTLSEWAPDGGTTRARCWHRDGVKLTSHSVRAYSTDATGWRYKAGTPDGEHGVVSDCYETRALAEAAADAWLAMVCMRPRGKSEKILNDLIACLGGPIDEMAIFPSEEQ